MKFVDEVQVHVKAGDGGKGAVAFRREKFMPHGGPSGGDGGRGGTVFLEADENFTTLLDYRFRPTHSARNGEPGGGSDCNGRDAPDIVLKVPVGTTVKDAVTGELLFDLSQNGQKVVLAQGGKGGLGNMNFATSTRQAPRFSQPGIPGEEREVVLELRLLADVGLLGYPNAGKSTLISRVSRARPKVADYPFTTLTPHLGVVQYKDGLSFVMADIPGIIEGAHAGAGLGHQFLKHVERCRLLVHLVDCGALGDDRDPLQDLNILNRELALYSEELAGKPQIIAANKVDLPDAREKAAKFVAEMARKRIPVFQVSSATGEGMDKLLDAIGQHLYAKPAAKPKLRAEDKAAAAASTAEQAPEEPTAKKAPAKKAPAKKAPAKKAPAKKAPAKKAPAKKAPAKKATKAPTRKPAKTKK